MCGLAMSLNVVSQLLLDGLPMGYSEKLRIKFGIDHFGYR